MFWWDRLRPSLHSVAAAMHGTSCAGSPENWRLRAALFALDVRISFYREIGFQEIASEYVLERQDIPKEQQEKGAL